MKYFLETLKDKNELLFVYGTMCLIGAICCLLLSKTSSIQILGISGWIKPFKFFLSVTILAYSMGYYMQYLDNQRQVKIYSWSLIILLSIELILIVYQVYQGKISHFNQEDSFGKTIFSIMALVITTFMLHTTYIAILFFIQKQFEASEVLILAIQLSFILTIVFAFEGFAMGAILKHTVGANDGGEGLPVVNWSKNHGDLRVAHFFGIHALQIIPLLSVIVARNRREVIIISVLYFAFVTYTLIQALLGKPFIKL